MHAKPFYLKDLRELGFKTFDGIIEFIDQDASAKQSADAAADEARRLTEEAHAASAAQAAENDAMRAAEEAEAIGPLRDRAC